jgi:hypothetical protein
MKLKVRRAPWLKGYHWEDLADLHTELCFLRHRIILTTNERIAGAEMESLETLDRLAQVDDLMNSAVHKLEKAKTILFDVSYDQDPARKARRSDA